MKRVILTNKNLPVHFDFDNLESGDINETLRERMLTGIVHFAFTKKDGSTREAFGTLQSEKITTPSGEGAKTNAEVTGTYFDIEANAWRSYTIANLIAVY